MLAKLLLRNHLTYANVVSSLCLFILLGGTAYAGLSLARGSVKGKHIARNAITSTKVKDASLLAQDFAAGELPEGEKGDRGDPGAPGADGADGEDGTDGATGSALLTGHATGLPSPPENGLIGTQAAVSGLSAAGTERQSLSPNRTLIARDMTARVGRDLPEGGEVSITFLVFPAGLAGGSSASLGCTVIGGAGTNDRSCTAAGPIVVPANSEIVMSIRVSRGIGAGTTNPVNAYWGITVEPG